MLLSSRPLSGIPFPSDGGRDGAVHRRFLVGKEAVRCDYTAFHVRQNPALYILFVDYQFLKNI